MNDETSELIHNLQVQQIDLNNRLMDKWSEIGDLVSDILENNHKILAILKEESDRK